MSDEFVETCPTDVVRAPLERIWAHLTEPTRLEWVDAKLIDAPPRTLAVGDRLSFAASLGLRVSWTVLAIDPPRSIALHIGLPFGMANRETVVLSPIDAQRCRITFN
jgi:hypothetical protein